MSATKHAKDIPPHRSGIVWCELALFLASLCLALGVGAATNDYFVIRVVDAETGRGIPLVELETVNHVKAWTDSAGVVAFLEPGLMGIETYFRVASPGYEWAKDGFGNRGVRWVPVAGGNATLALRRTNIAERLYRLTGQGIYRDSVLAGLPVPLKEPIINAQVMGQDTVIATPYLGRVYWFWGDTDRASYPLGNFGAAGATSALPGSGGLDVSRGIDFDYFKGPEGFARPMCPDPDRDLRWIESVMTVRDEQGRERLVARVSHQKGLKPAEAWYLMLFDDERGQFKPIERWDVHEGHDASHPFRVRSGGIDYWYLYPNWRVRADLPSLRDLSSYESFTCVAGDGRVNPDSKVERNAEGKPRYAWKAGADRLHMGRMRTLIDSGKLSQDESWMDLHDVSTGERVAATRGSVAWNAYRHRWVAILAGKAGEVWFSEADTPTGPWVHAVRVASHGDYNFYNPVHHSFLDEDGGRTIYFEGTYTAAFAKAKEMTPRYEYNQILYRLRLDDDRLRLPGPDRNEPAVSRDLGAEPGGSR